MGANLPNPGKVSPMRKLQSVLSNGDTLGLKVTRDLVQTLFTEVPSYRRTVGTLAWLDSRMYLVTRTQYVPISHPDYAVASTRERAAELALRFFTESADSVIAHAEAEGISPAECY